jgi:hypothetical protein
MQEAVASVARTVMNECAEVGILRFYPQIIFGLTHGTEGFFDAKSGVPL